MPAAARDPLVIRDLSFRYDTVAVLEDLSLALQRGSTTVVLGPAEAGAVKGIPPHIAGLVEKGESARL